MLISVFWSSDFDGKVQTSETLITPESFIGDIYVAGAV